jgi:hypothetical protein
MNTHCNRCGLKVDELLPEIPPPGSQGSLAVDMEETPGALYLVCRDCLGTETPFRYCSRCGLETPTEELSAGGQCAWCRGTESIPFEEPDDDEWWEGKTP